MDTKPNIPYTKKRSLHLGGIVFFLQRPLEHNYTNQNQRKLMDHIQKFSQAQKKPLSTTEASCDLANL